MILGTWRITYTWTVNGQDLSVDYPNRRDDDDPYYEVVGNTGYFTSRRTGERWELVTYSAWTVTNVRRLFIPDTPPQIKYDCINGSCKPQNVYNTPGFYNSLEECEINCGKCISNSDWSKIENLASQLKNKNCG